VRRDAEGRHVTSLLAYTVARCHKMRHRQGDFAHARRCQTPFADIMAKVFSGEEFRHGGISPRTRAEERLVSELGFGLAKG
jgi:hypothetical protein